MEGLEVLPLAGSYSFGLGVEKWTLSQSQPWEASLSETSRLNSPADGSLILRSLENGRGGAEFSTKLSVSKCAHSLWCQRSPRAWG